MDDNERKHAESATLHSWKAIANYLKRRVRTVQRWERHEGLPVHRHRHQKKATVYAYKDELDAWLAGREQQQANSEPSRLPYLLIATLAATLVTAAWLASTLISPKPDTGLSTIVVLPFDNLSSEERMQFLSDGLTEELGTQLARIDYDTLRVIARTSAMSYRDRDASVEDIRDELGVDFVLVGSVRPEDTSVRISAQLIDAETQTHLWAQSYDFQGGAWLALQDQATERIATAVAATLGLDHRVDIRIADRTLEAHEYVLLGHRYMDHIDGFQAPKAIEHFNRAIQIDDTAVEAYFGLAVSYSALAFNDAITLKEGYGKAREYASRILELEPNNADAIAMMGWAKFAYDWDWVGAREDLEKSVSLSPNSHWPHWIYANFLSAMGEHEPAVEHIRTAHRINPMAEITNVALGYILTGARRYEESAAVLEAFAERTGGRGRGFLINSYDFGQQYQSAIDLLRDLNEELATSIEESYRQDGADGYWSAWREHYARRQERNPDFFLWREAVVHLKLGETEAALDVLERGFHRRSGQMAFLLTYPLDPLHDHPRYLSLLERMNLPSTQ